MGKFITHTDCAVYTNADKSMAVVVSYDYSFGKKVLGIPRVCEAASMAGNLFYKKSDSESAGSVPSKFTPEKTGNDVIRIDNDTVLIGGITVDVGE